jgi:hypothetical protein
MGWLSPPEIGIWIDRLEKMGYSFRLCVECEHPGNPPQEAAAPLAELLENKAGVAKHFALRYAEKHREELREGRVEQINESIMRGDKPYAILLSVLDWVGYPMESFRKSILDVHGTGLLREGLEWQQKATRAAFSPIDCAS